MALATRCPNCSSRFRVATDQLKLRGGMVRCGSCRHVFDATAALDFFEHPREQPRAEAPGSEGARASPGGAAPPTLRDSMPAARGETGGDAGGKPSGGGGAGGGAQANGEADAATAPSGDAAYEPEFLRANHPGSRFARLRAVAVIALALSLPAGIIYAQRTTLLAVFPSLREQATRACAALGCDLPWPRRPDQIAIVGTEMQTLPGTDVIEFSAVLRNRADFAIAMPALEITLSDSFNHPLVRRVFLPGELSVTSSEPPVAAGASIAAGADVPLRLAVEAPGIAALNYVVYPFYP
jgi:predicted Zn finger-like uncharacterized protein